MDVLVVVVDEVPALLKKPEDVGGELRPSPVPSPLTRPPEN